MRFKNIIYVTILVSDYSNNFVVNTGSGKENSV